MYRSPPFQPPSLSAVASVLNATHMFSIVPKGLRRFSILFSATNPLMENPGWFNADPTVQTVGLIWFCGRFQTFNCAAAGAETATLISSLNVPLERLNCGGCNL